MSATIERVHNARLVDVRVVDHAEEQKPAEERVGKRVGFVPLVHEGDPDPQSPCGRCFWSKEA